MIYVMSGSGLSKCSIIVHVKTGSTVAAYSNSAATTKVKDAKEIGTSGSYVITGLNTGTYYIKATKGSESTISSAITFSAYAVKSVSLNYYLYLFNKPTQSAATVRSQWTFNNSLTLNDGNNYFVFEFNATSAVTRCCYKTTGIDLTNYNSCEVYGYASADSNDNKFGFYTSKDLDSPLLFTASKKLNTTPQSHILDISNLGGVYYPKFSVNGSNGANNKIYCQYLRLR